MSEMAQVLRPEMPANLPEEAVPEVQPTELLPEEEDAGDRARLPRRQGEDEVEEEVEEVDEDGEPVKRRRKRRKSAYAPCPGCGSRRAARVMWTFWGSFYGPAMFTHVRCPDCGTTFNGNSGRSNLIPAILFVMVPLLLLFAICGGMGLWFWYNSPGKTTPRRGEAVQLPAWHARANLDLHWRTPS